jgi:uncharacterized protein YbaP (TraB family)
MSLVGPTTQQDPLAQTIALAKLNEEAVQNMCMVEGLVRRERELSECVESMRREAQVNQCEAKALMQRNDEMKNAFAILLDRF